MSMMDGRPPAAIPFYDAITAVPGAGLEPARPVGLELLKLMRLPFRHPGGL